MPPIEFHNTVPSTVRGPFKRQVVVRTHEVANLDWYVTLMAVDGTGKHVAVYLSVGEAEVVAKYLTSAAFCARENNRG